MRAEFLYPSWYFSKLECDHCGYDQDPFMDRECEECIDNILKQNDD